MKTTHAFRALAVLATLGAAAPASAQLLSYTLSSELVKPGCQYDTDGDCLDNMLEEQLAQAASPIYFYDEDENCSWRQQARFARKDFIQVRPESPALANWPGTTHTKRVRVTYFLLHPRDCQDYVVAGGHQGDGEKVEFTLVSTDSRTWFLETSRYWHHHSPWHRFSGFTLANLARSIGSLSPVVAADEDGHGSWPGRAKDSQDCAGDEDSSFNDCFDGNLGTAFANGRFEHPQTFRNIGGPAPERWNASLLSVSGDTASSFFDVGFGFNPEFWSGGTTRFCGFQCSRRASNGDCAVSADGDTTCSDGLQTKVDRGEWAQEPLHADYVPDNSLLRNWADGAIYVVQGGAKFWIPSMDWFARLGLHESRVRDVSPGAIAQLPNVPRDGTLLMDPATGAVSVIHGGARLHIQTTEQMVKLGYGWHQVRSVPSQALSALSTVPRDGTIFTTEDGTGRVYAMHAGAKFWIPDGGYFARAGYDWAKLKYVPSTAVAALPWAPTGTVDVAGADGWVRGWAFDADVPAGQLGVHLYVDGPAGVGTFVASTTTSVFRGDVNQHYALYNLSGNHGYEVQLPAWLRDGTTHFLYVYAIDHAGRHNPWLDARPHAFTWGF